MSTLKKFAGQTVIYGITTVLPRVLNFLLTKLYVTAYPAKVYGVFTYMFSIASMMNAVLSFGMETTFFRYLNKSGNDSSKVYNSTFIVVACLSAIFLSGAILFSQSLAELMYEPQGHTSLEDYATYIRYFTFILVADALAVIPFAKVRSDGRPGRYGVIKLINIFTFIGLNLFFILLIPKILAGDGQLAAYFSWYKEQWVGYVFLSNLIASILTLILLTPEFIKLKLKADWALIRNMLSYSFPILIANISFIINENLDKVFLKELLPAERGEIEVGIYGACAKIAIFLSIFIQAFRLGAEPFFFSHQKNNESSATYATIMTYFVIAISLIFVALVANIEVLKYFIKSEDPAQRELYWSGLKIVPILLFGYVSLGIYMNLSIWYKLSDQTRYGLYISGIGAIVTIVLNLLFIPQYGYIASAWISLSAYTAMMVLSYIFGQKNYPIPYNLKKNLAYLAASVVLVSTSFIVFNRDLILGNILLFLFLAATFLIEKNELKHLLKNENPGNK